MKFKISKPVDPDKLIQTIEKVLPSTETVINGESCKVLQFGFGQTEDQLSVWLADPSEENEAKARQAIEKLL